MEIIKYWYVRECVIERERESESEQKKAGKKGTDGWTGFGQNTEVTKRTTIIRAAYVWPGR